MKKVFLAILLIFNLFLLTPLIAYAEDTTTDTSTSVEQQSDTSTTAQESESTVSTQQSGVSLLTILVAVITPLLLIVVAYLIIKMLKL